MLCVIVLLIGCPEVQQVVKPVIEPKEMPPTQPTTPAKEVVKPSVDTTPPSVVSIRFFRDWQRTKELTEQDIVHPGNTIHIEIVFNRAMQHRISDNDDGLPDLSYAIGEETKRFRIVGYGASKDEGFTSGTGKPLHTDTYLCRVLLPTNSTEIVSIQVNTGSIDKTGIPITETVIQAVPFTVWQPSVTSVQWYWDQHLTEKITKHSTVYAGDTLYTEIMFDGAMHVRIGDRDGLPEIAYTAGEVTERFRVVRYGVNRNRGFTAGVCKPLNPSRYLCMITIPTDNVAAFSIEVGTESISKTGIPVAEATVHTAPFPIQYLSDNLEWQRATELEDEMGKKYAEIWQSSSHADFENGTFSRKITDMQIEITGIPYFTDRFVSIILRNIYGDIFPEQQQRLLDGDFSVRGISITFIFLSLTHPEKTKDELLQLFEEFVRKGRVSIEPSQ